MIYMIRRGRRDVCNDNDNLGVFLGVSHCIRKGEKMCTFVCLFRPLDNKEVG